MSYIFDALQRSEGERSGLDTSDPSETTELLKRAERRAASTWEATGLVEEIGRFEVAGRDVSPRSEEKAHDARARKAPTTDALSSDGARLDVFDQFKSLQISLAPENRLQCLAGSEGPAAEAFRLLGMRLRHLRQDRPLKKVLITGTVPQEGKSTVSVNLACTLALGTRSKVLLIEGDMRRPSFSQILGIGKNPGLSECLQDKQTLLKSIYYLEGAGVWVLPAGSTPGNAMELLQSGKISSLMSQLAEWFEWVIIDSPPVLPLADTSVWARLADGVLLVARQGATEKRRLQRGLDAIPPNKLLGAVLNCSQNSSNADYYYRKSAV